MQAGGALPLSQEACCQLTAADRRSATCAIVAGANAFARGPMRSLFVTAVPASTSTESDEERVVSGRCQNRVVQPEPAADVTCTEMGPRRACDWRKNLGANIMGTVRSVALLLAVLCTESCVYATSTHQAATNNSLQEGLSYFLPTRRVRVLAIQKHVTTAEQKKKLDEATAAAKQASDASTAAAKAVTEAEAKLKAAEGIGNADAIKDAQKKVAEAKADEVMAKQRVLQEAGKLVALQRELAVTGVGDESCQLTLKVELLDPEPDPAAHYVLNMNHSFLSEDELTVSVDAKGLLSTAGGVSTDRSADIAVAAVQLISAMKAPSTKAFEGSAKPADCTTKHVDLIFDPANEESWKEASKQLKGGSGRLSLKVVDVRADVRGKSDAKETREEEAARENAEAAARQKIDGIAYRTLTPYILQVTDENSSSVISSTVVLLPNSGPVSFIPFQRAMFVESVDEVEFAGGMPTKWHTKKPNEVLAVLAAPIRALKATMEIPAELVQLRVNYTNDNTALVAAQKAQLEAIEALRKLKEASEEPESETPPVTP